VTTGTTAAPTTAAAAPTTAPSAAATTAPTAAVAAGPESKKQLIAWITTEPVDNDINRDTYNQGPTEQVATLLKYDQDFNIQPDLAETYTNNGPVFTFKIRNGAVWSDGMPLTAQDFVYSLRRQIDPRTANGYGSYWDGVIKGAADFSGAKPDDPNLDKLSAAVAVRAVDNNTFEVTGDAAYGLIPAQYAFVAAGIAREDQVKKYSDSKGVSSWTDPGKTGAPVVSCGPYIITAWKHNVALDFVKNDKYWMAPTIRQRYLSRLILPDLVKSTLSYENNDIDWQQIPATEVDRFKGDAKLKSQTYPYINPNTRFLVPDTGHPPFDNIQVRQATLLSIDKDRLVNQVGRKVHTIAYAMTAPGVFGYFDDTDDKLKNLQKFDQTAAMNALKGTSFEGGRNWPKVTLTYNVSDPDIPAGFPDEIARQLKESINMDVQIEPLDAKVWNARRFALDVQFLLYRWYEDYPDPHDEYYLVWALHNKGAARQSWKDDQFDMICKQAAAETDKQKRLDLYYQAETRLLTQWVYMPLYWETINYAIKPWVTGIPKNKQGYLVPNNNIFARAYDTVFVTDDSPHDPPK
jgi:ABC-type transport system substrate-binding protein